MPSNSDAIPVHLITSEAFHLYRRHLKPDGVICVHISNRYLSLEPVVVKAAKAIGMDHIGWRSGGSNSRGLMTADWLIVSNNRTFQQSFQRKAAEVVEGLRRSGIDDFEPLVGSAVNLGAVDPDFRAWTDDYSNLFDVLK